MDPLLDTVLPEGVARVEGEPPAEPEDYGDTYTLPEHSEKPLQTLHSHPLDTDLKFYAVSHVYTFQGIPLSISVTGVAHQFEKPFKALETIDGMKTGRSQAWPRLEYVHNGRPLVEEDGGGDGDSRWSHDHGALRVANGKTVSVVHPYSMDPRSTVAQVREMLRVSTVPSKGVETDEGELYVFDRAMEDDEIVAMWARNGMIASHKGTEAHYLAECFFNGIPFRWWDPDIAVLFRFCHTHLIPRKITGYNTEKEIVCVDADVAGSIDLIVWDPLKKVHHIIDFKRSEKLQSQLRGYSKMSAPFKHLDDCKGAGYAIQTSLYQYILERDYGMTIGDRILLSLHADRPFVTSVPYMRAEVEYIMENRFELVRARNAVMDAHGDRFRCELTGAPIVDAVQLEDGRMVMEKAAQVHDMEYSVMTHLRNSFDAEVAKVLKPVEFDATACKSWRRQMPEGGIPPFQ